MAQSWCAPENAFICNWCMSRIGHEEVVIDHFLPLALGGDNDISNLTVASHRCNSTKGAMHPRDAEPYIFAMCDAEWERGH